MTPASRQSKTSYVKSRNEVMSKAKTMDIFTYKGEPNSTQRRQEDNDSVTMTQEAEVVINKVATRRSRVTVMKSMGGVN